MKIIEYITASVVFIALGFILGCLMQPILIVSGHDFCMTGQNPDYTLSEVQDINSKIKELSIQNAYAVPYGKNDTKIIIYEFCPWGKSRIEEKHNQIRKLLKPVETKNKEF